MGMGDVMSDGQKVRTSLKYVHNMMRDESRIRRAELMAERNNMSPE